MGSEKPKFFPAAPLTLREHHCEPCTMVEPKYLTSLILVYQMHRENKGRVIRPVFANSLVSETKRYLRLLPPQGQREGTTNTLEIPTCQRITF